MPYIFYYFPCVFFAFIAQEKTDDFTNLCRLMYFFVTLHPESKMLSKGCPLYWAV